MTREMLAKLAAMQAQMASILAPLAVRPPIESGNQGGFNVDGWIRHFARSAAEQIAPQAGSGFRVDTATALFAQQLQAVMARSYDRQYPALMMRGLMPAAGGIPAGAETVTQRGFDVTGRPALLVNEGTEIPRVSLYQSENVGRVAGYGIKWRITYPEMLAAAMAGVELNGKGLMKTGELQEREIDFLLANGNAALGLVGMLSHATKAPAAAGAGVELYTTGAPAAFVGDWDGVATAAQILNDFAILFAKWYAMGGVNYPTDCIFGSNSWARIETLQAFATSDKTVLQVLQERYPRVRFQHVWRCDLANAGGTNDRCVLYARTPDVIESVVPLEPTQLPQVWDGFAYETVNYMRCGGVLMNDTTGIAYIDM